MKLPAAWKSFYLRCLEVPFIGRTVIGPYLRLLWRIVAWFGRDRMPQSRDDGRITTYASTIDSLRRQIDAMEQRVQRLERELEEARASAEASSLLLSSALEGIARRSAEQQDTMACQQLITSAALGALRNRR